MAMTSKNDEEEGIELVPQEVVELLLEYEDVFQLPNSLPPSRSVDHAIPLKPGAQPFKLKPYRYPHCHNEEIEKQVAEMLHKGITKHNNSPFASPVLLVKENEGTWRFCVDYRKLNEITIKDRFPIPNELLDELAGFIFKTKLDLTAGYHQIRVKPQDTFKTCFQTHYAFWAYKCSSYIPVINEPTPVLQLPNFKKAFIIETDASERGIGAPIPVPKQTWSHISMDFIEKLPRSQGYDTILVVIDKLTKFGHFIMLTHPFTAKNVAQVFLDNIYKIHGLPESIIIDRDRVFTSGFWKELFRMVGTKLHYSSFYHSQSDGQSERLNQCLENYLRCMTGEFPSQWSKWLSLVERSYNSTYQSSLTLTPFEALFGYKPVPLPLGPYFDSMVLAATNMVQEISRISSSIKEHLAKAQQRMKHYADQHRIERSFAVGDWVFLKLQPYRQQTVAVRKCLKLSARHKIATCVPCIFVKEEIGTIAEQFTQATRVG
ncbi:uncharacterized protein [Coffea arabica]|uniref:Integrase catalytic domain-containing protein n=1 Tax=Coffea arabica TaxID=13443 RepID=A0ABM4WB80_COFAR